VRNLNDTSPSGQSKISTVRTNCEVPFDFYCSKYSKLDPEISGGKRSKH